jgi:hypothetical protein
MIRMEDAVIGGGQALSPDQPLLVHDAGRVEKTVWVSIAFTEHNEPVLPFLAAPLEGVDRIVERIVDSAGGMDSGEVSQGAND